MLKKFTTVVGGITSNGGFLNKNGKVVSKMLKIYEQTRNFMVLWNCKQFHNVHGE